jgi:hypothetical protein
MVNLLSVRHLRHLTALHDHASDGRSFNMQFRSGTERTFQAR